MTTAERPRRRGTWIVLALVAVLATLVTIASTLVRPRVEQAASAALGTPVKIGRITVGDVTRGEVVVRRVAIGDDDELTIARIAVDPDVQALLDGRIVLERIEIDGLDGTVEQDAEGRPMLRGLPFPQASDESGPAVTVHDVVLRDARIAAIPPRDLRRTPVEAVVDELLLRQVPTADVGPAWEGELRAVVDGVPLDARARAERVAAGTRILADAELRDAQVSSERAVLPPGFESLRARASGRVAYELDPEKKRDRLTVDVEVTDLSLDGAADTSLSARAVDVRGLVVDLGAGTTDLGRISITAPRISAELTDDGLFYPGLVPGLVGSGLAPPADDEPVPGKPTAGDRGRGAWRITGGRIDAKDGAIAVRRDEHRTSFTLPSFSWRDIRSGHEGELQLSLRADAGGTIDVSGRLGIDPPELDATIDVVSLALPGLAALAKPPLGLGRGVASATVQLTGDPASPRVVATLDVEDLHTTPPSSATPDRVLAVARLETRLSIAPGESRDVAIDWLRLSYPYAMIERDATGVFPLSVFATPTHDTTETSPASSSDVAESSPAPRRVSADDHRPQRTIRITSLSAEGGRVDFVDRTTAPPYWTGLAQIEASARGVRLAPPALDDLTLSGRQDEMHPVRATVRRVGDERWQGEAVVDGMSLATLNPYLSPVLGYEAQSGTLSLTLGGTLDGARLVATSELTLDDVAMRQTGLDVIQRETGVPLTVALGLLKDVSGEIELAVPVEVDTQTGRYALGSFVTQAIGRAVLGALSSPLRWLGMLFGTDGPPHALAIDPIPFAAGSAALDAAGTTRLTQVARILASHADLDVILKAQIAPADRDAVGEAGLTDLARRRVEAVRDAFASARYGAAILPSRLLIAPWTPPANGELDPAPGVYVELQGR